MKTTLFSTVSAIALTGLYLTLTPSTLSAHGSSRGGHSSGHSSRGSHRTGHGRTCRSLPHGCHASNYHGRSCWYGGGHYYGVCAGGGYEILDDQAEVDTAVVETTVVEQPVIAEETEDVSVSVLPDDAEVVYVGGEQCWYSGGCYYHRHGHGFTKSHCKDRARICKNGRHNDSRNHGTRCKTSGSRSHGSSHSTGHGSHSGGHGRK